ncbi:MAG: hypothetical protein OXH99_12725 [Bryobacterales bacterium]|nr:hypothetical protein [Bryobacterales bacterium]
MTPSLFASRTDGVLQRRPCERFARVVVERQRLGVDPDESDQLVEVVRVLALDTGGPR